MALLSLTVRMPAINLPLIPLRLPCPDNLATPKHITDKRSATRKDMRVEQQGGYILTHTHTHTQANVRQNEALHAT